MNIKKIILIMCIIGAMICIRSAFAEGERYGVMTKDDSYGNNYIVMVYESAAEALDAINSNPRTLFPQLVIIVELPLMEIDVTLPGEIIKQWQFVPAP